MYKCSPSLWLQHTAVRGADAQTQIKLCRQSKCDKPATFKVKASAGGVKVTNCLVMAKKSPNSSGFLVGYLETDIQPQHSNIKACVHINHRSAVVLKRQGRTQCDADYPTGGRCFISLAVTQRVGGLSFKPTSHGIMSACSSPGPPPMFRETAVGVAGSSSRLRTSAVSAPRRQLSNMSQSGSRISERQRELALLAPRS